ncbi:N-acetyltransferase [Cobetia sp.]|uniref:GNAT family N-acetyltransferase n=1 Tax=Cobetia sp. TaxID=1873876 RepID=UPI000C4C3D91|nr:N-acetyltransferase [Cobetia sp.]MBF08170.1 GNAT family N-acetyltransferase [Cobetia sp.]HAR09340.1 GNAT family N-acetyltransferase [Cobetia sp.]HBJ27174.1 GNAT family N-acetyltransferase [Cobetia sp.]|tara:strand:+ start:15557 stop:16198 length:642 start_codon:yes stop_codon:yes gene_type:complete
MIPILRPAIRADLDALVELEEVSFDSDWFSRRQLSHLILRAHARTLVIIQPDDDVIPSAPAVDDVMAALWPAGSVERDDSTPLRSVLGYGTVLFRRNSRRARLYSFCLHPESRGRGLAQRMLTSLEQLAIAQGCTQFDLEVHTGNGAAIALYERHGFEKCGRLRDYYADGAAAWKMRKALTLDSPAPVAEELAAGEAGEAHPGSPSTVNAGAA